MTDRVTYREMFRRIPADYRAMNRQEKGTFLGALAAAVAGAVLVAVGTWPARLAGIFIIGLLAGMLVTVTLAASGYRRKYEHIRDGREHYREN